MPIFTPLLTKKCFKLRLHPLRWAFGGPTNKILILLYARSIFHPGGWVGSPQIRPWTVERMYCMFITDKKFSICTPCLTENFPFAPTPLWTKIFHLHPTWAKSFHLHPPECRIHRGGSEGCLDPWDEKLISHRTNCKSGGVNEISVRWVPYGSRCESKWVFLQQHVSSGNVLNLYLYIFSTLVKKLAKSWCRSPHMHSSNTSMVAQRTEANLTFTIDYW